MVEAGTVAVVVRTKDRPALLARALDDIAAQTLVAERPHAVRVVVVNDGGDAAVVAEQLAGHPLAADVTVVDNASSRGRWPAANQGIAAAPSDYVVLHDDDDTWESGFLAATTAYLDEPANAEYAGVVTFTDVVHESGADDGYRTLSREPFAREIQHISLIELCRRNQFPPIAFLYRRSLHDAVGEYDESMPVVADWEFNLRAVRRFDVALITEHLANWHLRDAGGSAADSNVTTAASWQYDEHKVRLFNRLLREDLDAGTLGLGYLTNVLQAVDGLVSSGDANLHEHLQQTFEHLRGLDEHLIQNVENARVQLLRKPNTAQMVGRVARGKRP